jgi:predicted DsbA family dithiol-disulfide isomerase
MSRDVVSVGYFSDLLCVWAYVAEIRLDELRRNFPSEIALQYRFVPVFGNTEQKIGERWAERGGYEGYATHVRGVLESLNHVEVHPAVWTENIPASSHGAHAFVEAGELAAAGVVDPAPRAEYDGRTALQELSWRLRVAFFQELRDIGRLDVQLEVAAEMDLPVASIRARLEDGSAFAALAEDYDAASRFRVTGSPTFLLNEGRQTLYGNVGYRIIEANIQELLRDKRDMASWC